MTWNGSRSLQGEGSDLHHHGHAAREACDPDKPLNDDGAIIVLVTNLARSVTKKGRITDQRRYPRPAVASLARVSDRRDRCSGLPRAPERPRRYYLALTNPFDVVLFDLGGVLIDLRGLAPMKELTSIENDDELWRRWLTCRWVRSFERGMCSAEDFAVGVVNDWGLAVTPETFLDSFGSWVVGPLAGADALLEMVRRAIPVGCLSNTNALHWEKNFARWPILDAFDFRFLSFEVGMVKPDAEIFDHVASLVPAPPNRVLFLDDNAVNVEAAAAAGFAAVHARGVSEAHRVLASAGIVPT
jgi:FMN phosphatase YigB (HAD superfamily)